MFIYHVCLLYYMAIDDKVNLVPKQDRKFYQAISKYTGKRSLTVGEKQILRMIQKNLKNRYVNYSESETYRSIDSCLSKQRVGIMAVTGSFNHMLSRDMTAMYFDIKDTGLLDENVRQVIAERIDKINADLYPQYFHKAMTQPSP